MKRFKFLPIITALFICSPGFPQKIPSPEEFFGFPVAADYHLLDYEQALGYWRKLEGLSAAIKLFDYGKSSEGRPMVLAAVSTPENLARLDQYKNIAKRLSLVRNLSENEARRLASEGKAIVWIDGGLHSDEVAPAQHIIQLTYDLLATDSPDNKNILDDVIVLLALPNPDGMDMVAGWYKKNLGTPYETSPLPWLYQKYIGHDNNRDSFMLSVAETRAINRAVHHEWYPHIFYNHHQRSPFPSLIFVPPDCEPTNPNLPPLLLRWQNFIGAAIAKAFEAEGKQGVISRFLFDTWYPGYVTQVCDFHNIISAFSETFLYHYATPHFYEVEDFPQEYRDFTTSLFFTNPWQGGWWRLRDSVEYCLTASKSVLELAAKHRAELLYDKYAMGKETVERYRKEPPFGWVVPLKQRDEGAAAGLINLLIELDIEVYQAEEAFRADGLEHPAGTIVLPTSQPFGRLLKTLFEVQVYPDLRKYPFLWQSIVEPLDLKVPPLRTYDVLGWTLPLQMGVKAIAVNSPLEKRMKRIQEAPRPKAFLKGSGSYGYAVPYERISAVRAVNDLLKSDVQVLWAKEAFSTEGQIMAPGTFLVPAARFSPERMKALTSKYLLEVSRLKNKPSGPMYNLQKPRVGIYQPWTENMDEGWTRLVLEEYGFPFTILHNAEIRAGGLKERFDVIIIPDESPDFILNGHPQGSMPPEYTGGISASGVRALKEFIEKGGTLVALGSSCDFAIDEFRLPVRNVVKSLNPEEFFASGLLVRVVLDPSHHVAYGMPREASGFFGRSPTFQLMPAADDKKQAKVIGKYPEENLVLSGWMYGEKYLKNRTAAAEVPLGDGRVILLGFRVQHRGQTVGTFRLLFNSLFSAGAQSLARRP